MKITSLNVGEENLLFLVKIQNKSYWHCKFINYKLLKIVGFQMIRKYNLKNFLGIFQFAQYNYGLNVPVSMSIINEEDILPQEKRYIYSFSQNITTLRSLQIQQSNFLIPIYEKAQSRLVKLAKELIKNGVQFQRLVPNKIIKIINQKTFLVQYIDDRMYVEDIRQICVFGRQVLYAFLSNIIQKIQQYQVISLPKRAPSLSAQQQQSYQQFCTVKKNFAIVNRNFNEAQYLFTQFLAQQTDIKQIIILTLRNNVFSWITLLRQYLPEYEVIITVTANLSEDQNRSIKLQLFDEYDQKQQVEQQIAVDYIVVDNDILRQFSLKIIQKYLLSFYYGRLILVVTYLAKSSFFDMQLIGTLLIQNKQEKQFLINQGAQLQQQLGNIVTPQQYGQFVAKYLDFYKNYIIKADSALTPPNVKCSLIYYQMTEQQKKLYSGILLEHQQHFVNPTNKLTNCRETLQQVLFNPSFLNVKTGTMKLLAQQKIEYKYGKVDILYQLLLKHKDQQFIILVEKQINKIAVQKLISQSQIKSTILHRYSNSIYVDQVINDFNTQKCAVLITDCYFLQYFQQIKNTCNIVLLQTYLLDKLDIYNEIALLQQKSNVKYYQVVTENSFEDQEQQYWNENLSFDTASPYNELLKSILFKAKQYLKQYEKVIKGSQFKEVLYTEKQKILSSLVQLENCQVVEQVYNRKVAVTSNNINIYYLEQFFAATSKTTPQAGRQLGDFSLQFSQSIPELAIPIPQLQIAPLKPYIAGNLQAQPVSQNNIPVAIPRIPIKQYYQLLNIEQLLLDPEDILIQLQNSLFGLQLYQPKSDYVLALQKLAQKITNDDLQILFQAAFLNRYLPFITVNSIGQITDTELFTQITELRAQTQSISAEVQQCVSSNFRQQMIEQGIQIQNNVLYQYDQAIQYNGGIVYADYSKISSKNVVQIKMPAKLPLFTKFFCYCLPSQQSYKTITQQLDQQVKIINDFFIIISKSRALEFATTVLEFRKMAIQVYNQLQPTLHKIKANQDYLRNINNDNDVIKAREIINSRLAIFISRTRQFMQQMYKYQKPGTIQLTSESQELIQILIELFITQFADFQPGVLITQPWSKDFQVKEDDK